MLENQSEWQFLTANAACHVAGRTLAVYADAIHTEAMAALQQKGSSWPVAGSSAQQPAVQLGCHLLDNQTHHINPFKERSQTPI